MRSTVEMNLSDSAPLNMPILHTSTVFYLFMDALKWNEEGKWLATMLKTTFSRFWIPAPSQNWDSFLGKSLNLEPSISNTLKCR